MSKLLLFVLTIFLSGSAYAVPAIVDYVLDGDTFAAGVKIDDDVKKNINESQKEYYLREKIRAIQDELGDKVKKDSDVEALREKIKDMNPNSYLLLIFIIYKNTLNSSSVLIIFIN